MRELYAHFMVFYVPISLVVFALAYVAGWMARGREAANQRSSETAIQGKDHLTTLPLDHSTTSSGGDA